MLALRIASLGRIPDTEVFGMNLPNDINYENEYEGMIFIDRRIGFDIGRYFQEYYRIPHHLVGDDIQRGDIIQKICGECFSEQMFDSQREEFYCPMCYEE